jgi:V/A-type H+-transporting ATPase subunit G/H
MKSEVLSKIKAAEAEAQQMINEAQAQKEKTIEDAKRKSFEIIDASEKEARKIADDLNASADLEISTATQAIRKTGEEDILRIKERAEKKHAEALSYLAEEFKRTHYV